MNYGNTHVSGRSIFSSRKVRSNKGSKRGPRPPVTMGNGVIVVNSGGVANVHAAPKYRGKGRSYGSMFVGPLRPQNTRKVRATRSNVGVARGGREGTKANLMRKRQKFAKQLGLKRVPGKGVKRNIINRAVRNGKITL